MKEKRLVRAPTIIISIVLGAFIVHCLKTEIVKHRAINQAILDKGMPPNYQLWHDVDIYGFTLRGEKWNDDTFRYPSRAKTMTAAWIHYTGYTNSMAEHAEIRERHGYIERTE